jgi:hypothetical protein
MGIRRWFESHGFDFKLFLKEGIDVETFLATGDAYAIEIVEKKRAGLLDG